MTSKESVLKKFPKAYCRMLHESKKFFVFDGRYGTGNIIGEGTTAQASWNNASARLRDDTPRHSPEEK